MIIATLGTHLLSGDGPRSRLLAVLLIAILCCLAFAPFLFPGTRSLNVAAKICVFILLVASYDLLLGYTGIVSFAHTMFFGIGGYGIALAMSRLGVSWGSIAIGSLAALALSLVLSLAVGLFSLRVRTIFFAMITLAIASFFALLASQLSDLTGGEDGITFRLPDLLSPGTKLLASPVFGVDISGRIATYYIVFAGSLAGFLLLLRIVNSPFGRVLQAIRENEFRAEAVGYRTVNYRTAASVVSALGATAAGLLYALWLRYSGPEVTLSFSIMVDILLMVVIGGMGTLYGAAIGATLFVLAQTYLQDLMAAASEATAGIPLLPVLIHPDRWLLWLGVLFVLSVYFLPSGLVGRLRDAPRGARGASPHLGAPLADRRSRIRGGHWNERRRCHAARAALWSAERRSRVRGGRWATFRTGEMNVHAMPSSHYATVLGRETHFTQWGDPSAPVLLAAHGLARTGRDMDELAGWFCGRYRVLCPDTIGRGLSQWSADPDAEYCLDFYVRHVTALLDTLGVERVAWVGTSMGGAIGMVAAAGPLRSRITRLVLNDSAPELAAEAIARIRAYAGNPAAFDTVTGLEQYFRTVYKPYGWLSDEQWRRLAETSARRLPDGRFTPHYDPQIVRQFHRPRDEYLLWDEYDSLTLPVLCLRGAQSDLVLRETTAQMQRRGPRARVVEIEDCGHAPALNTPDQLGLIQRFLDA